MANKPVSFSDWVAQNPNGIQPGSAPTVKGINKAAFLKGSSGASSKKSQPQDPLSWLMDIISRPLYGATHAGAVGAGIATKKNHEKQAAQLAHGDISPILSNIGANLAAPFQGFFGNAPEDKNTTSDLIEKGADVAGSYDPNYKDTPNNVNPLLKGGLGLVGDIAGDPTTWIPGAGIATVAKGIARAARGGEAVLSAKKTAQAAAELTKGTIQDATDIEKAATKAAPPVVETPSPASTLEAVSAKLGTVDPTATDTADTISKILSPEEATRIVSEARLSPRAASLVDGLSKIKPTQIVTEVAKAGKAARLTPLPFGITLGKGTEAWLPELNKTLEGFKKLSDVPIIKVNGKPVSIATVAADASNGSQPALKVLEQFHQQQYLPSFARAKQVGKEVDPLGRITEPKAQKITTETSNLTALQNYHQLIQDHTSGVADALGPKLVDALSKMSNPEKFDTMIQRLSGILGGQLNVHNLAKSNYTHPVRTLLRELGVDPDVIPVGVRQPQAERGLAPKHLDTPELRQRLAAMDPSGDPNYTIQLADRALNNSTEKDLIDPHTPSKYPFETKGGAKRTEDAYGNGWARRSREANTFYQWNAIKPMLQEVRKKVMAEGLFGASAASRMQQLIVPALRTVERFEEAHGVIHTIGVGADRIPISNSQILDILGDGSGAATMAKTYWNAGTAVPPTNLLDAVFAGLKGGNREAVKAELSKVASRYVRSDGSIKAIPNNLVTGGKFGRAVLKGDQLVNELTDHVMGNLGKIDKQASINDAAWKSRVASETYDMTDKTLASLKDAFENEAGYGPALQGISDTSRSITRQATEMGATQKAVEATDTIVDHAIPATDKANATKAVNVVNATEKAATTVTNVDTIQRAGVEAAQGGYDSYVTAKLSELGGFMPGGDSRDLGNQIDQVLGHGIMSKVMPIVSRRAGEEMLHEDLVQGEMMFKSLTSHTAIRLNKLARVVPKDQLAQLLNNVRRNIPHPNPAMAGPQAELADIWAQMFGREGQNALIDNAFFRENTNVHHLNGLLDYYHVGQQFDVEAAQTAAKENGTTFLSELSKQPQDWKIDDPADFLNKTYTSFVAAQTHQTIAHQFVKMATDMNLVSRVPKTGYALVANDSGKSIMAKYLPADVYFDDMILRQMNVVDNIMQDSFKWDSRLNDFIKNVFDPVQSAWKYGMTLINPSHHIRNAVSDASLTFMANGIRGKNSYTHAAQAMATHNGYSNWDAIKALQGLEQLPNAGKVVAHGKLGQLTADGLYAAAQNRGNLPNYKVLEQLEEMHGQGGLAKAWDRATESNVAQKIGGISEARDHYFRLAHFSQYVEQNVNNTKRFKTMKDLLDTASAETRRWHPDGSDLTSTERQVFRRLVPFYSWQRKSIPLIIEAMLTHPGRVSAFPKASYNIAVAMGVNPDSLSDPFPTDQMFPSYLTTQLSGPLFKVDGKYYGLNPGIASNDTLNTYVGNNPLQGILGQVSPIIRSPFELASGSNVGTGGKINDFSDYLDSNTPIAGPISRMTGTSVTGSIVSLLQGKGLDPQYQTAKGNKQGAELVPLLNYLGGVGITPMSQQNQINQAEIEKRNAAAQEGKVHQSGTGF